MANFSINIVTTNGRNLLAKSSSGTQLVIDRVLCLNNSYSEQQLDSSTGWSYWKTLAGFTQGTVDTIGVNNNSVRLVVGFNPVEGESVVKRTIIIFAREATKADADANYTTLMAVSDINSTFKLFGKGASIPDQRAQLQFQIALNQGETLNYTQSEAAYLTIGDSPRFVSCHLVGNQSQGEAQTIRGAKDFVDDLSANKIKATNITTKDGSTNLKLYNAETTNFINFKSNEVFIKTPTLRVNGSLVSADETGGYVSGYTIGTSALPWGSSYVSLTYTNGLRTTSSSYNSINLYNSIIPAANTSVSLGDSSRKISGIWTTNLNGTTAPVSYTNGLEIKSATGAVQLNTDRISGKVPGIGQFALLHVYVGANTGKRFYSAGEEITYTGSSSFSVGIAQTRAKQDFVDSNAIPLECESSGDTLVPVNSGWTLCNGVVRQDVSQACKFIVLAVRTK